MLRELNKALIGFVMVPDARHKVIATGKWGCGAFGGDKQLKFLLQWMAASTIDRPIIFHTFKDNEDLEKLGEITTRYLNGRTVGDVYGYLKRYSKGDSPYNLFDSIIKMVISDEEEQQRSKRKIELMKTE